MHAVSFDWKLQELFSFMIVRHRRSSSASRALIARVQILILDFTRCCPVWLRATLTYYATTPHAQVRLTSLFHFCTCISRFKYMNMLDRRHQMTWLNEWNEWMNEWMNEWKCSDLKCTRKPTKSRLSLTHHANKSSRWAE